MTRRELFKLIESGEGLQIEFKQKFSSHEKIAKEMVAFANTKGGVIIFGIRDNGKIQGVESEKGEAGLIKEAAEKFCEPPISYLIEYFDVDEKEIVCCTINEAKVKPHRLQDYESELLINKAQVYVRVNDKSVPASKEMIRILKAHSEEKKLYKYSIGKLEKAVFEYLDEHESVSVKELCNAANTSARRASRTLVKLVRAGMILIHTKDNGEEYFTYRG
ncbi:MAG: putative DNA binding domain-containing protein [Melioribacteraceae bacterium]|nr:putative DNA binding domain-containing protein [Melioribacteraceae bacterium]